MLDAADSVAIPHGCFWNPHPLTLLVAIAVIVSKHVSRILLEPICEVEALLLVKFQQSVHV